MKQVHLNIFLIALLIITGDTNYRWDLARIDIYADSEPFQMNIIAIMGYQGRALVAIDDISIKPWSCTVSSCIFSILLFL